MTLPAPLLMFPVSVGWSDLFIHGILYFIAAGLGVWSAYWLFLRYLGDKSRRVFREAKSREAESSCDAVIDGDNQFRAMIDSIDEMFSCHDLEGRFRFASKGALRMLGYRPDDLIGQSPFEMLFQEEDVPKASEVLKRMLRGETLSGKIELRYRHRDGQSLWVHCQYALIRHPGEKQDHILVFSRDITRRIDADLRLGEQRHLLERVLDSLPVSVLVAAPDGRRLYSNAAHEQLWGGLKPINGFEDYAAFRGWCLPSGIPIGAAEWGIVRALANRESATANLIRIVAFDNREKLVSYSSAPILSIEGELLAAVAVVEDVTERQHTVQEIARRESLLSEAQRIAQIGNWEWNIEPGGLLWSDEVFRIFGVEPQSFTPTYQDFLNRVHKEDREMVIEGVDLALKGRREYNVVYRIGLPGGIVHVVRARGLVERDAAGKPFRMAGTTQDITEYRRLTAAAELYSRLLEQTAEQVMITDREGTIEFVNDTFVKETGWSAEEAVGNTPAILRSGDHPSGFYKALWETLLAGRVFKGEFVNRKKTGELFHEEKVITPIFDDGGKITHFISTGRNITYRKMAERALNDAQQRYQGLVDNLRDAMIMDNEVGQIVYSNPAFQRLFGYDEAETLKLRIEDYVAPEWRKRLQDRHDHRMRGEAVPAHFEYEALRKDGSRFQAEATVSPVLTESGAIGTQSLIRDVTEVRAAERRENELQRAIAGAAREWLGTFDSVITPILVLDSGMCIRRLNQSARELLAQNYEALVGQPARVLAGAEPWNTLLRLLDERWSGSRISATVFAGCCERHWELTLSPMAAESEAPGGIVVVLRDVTEWIRMQEVIRQGELMASLGRLVGGVAHEVRNPLFAITANLDAWEQASGHSPSDDEFFKVLRGELTRLRGIMEELLEYGKPMKIERMPVLPGDLVREAVAQCRPQANRRGVTLAISIEEPLPLIRVDHKRLVEALRNLAENATQHAAGGSEVTLRCSSLHENNRQWITFTVEDRGPGFRAEDLPHLFEPFFSRRAGGTGLGLAMVQRIAEQHHGRADAANLEVGGARLRLRIPVTLTDEEARDA